MSPSCCLDNDDNHANAPSGSITPSTGTDSLDPVHDPAGNTTRMPKPVRGRFEFRDVNA